DLMVKNFFPEFDFTPGVGLYPFNRSNIIDAFFHVAMYMQKQEISTAKNPTGNSYISWGIGQIDTMGAGFQGDLSLSITGLPIALTIQSDQTIIKAKPYLI
ncbi:MAG: hypothetical protein ACRC78_11620, partial [Planktothrix sp.]